MIPSLSGEAKRLRHEDAGLSDLRRDALMRILGVLAICAFLLLLLSGIYISQVSVRPAYVALALAAITGLTARNTHHGVSVATTGLVLGLVGVIAGSIVLLPDAPVMAGLCVPVLIATVLLGTPFGLATLLSGGALVVAVTVHYTSIPLAHVVMLTFGLAGLILVCSIVLWRSFYTVLDWSWASYAAAQERAAELRERQVELGRLNQSLILAYEHIRQTSAQVERARHAAEEARRLKAEFAASVSHELRTPLNLIIGLSELMVVTPHAGAPGLPDVYRADVEAIYRNACHISNLIDDVLDLSQIEAHHMGLLKEWRSLHDIVSEATATVRTLFENTGLWLDVRLPDDLPPLFVDPVRIRQILINLLNNAVRFTEEGGVTIGARLEDEQVVVDVIDTGVGIAPQDLPGVFQEFWRSGEPRRGRRGSGLGLAVSKRFAELHGGNMWVTSSPGRGSTFSLALPRGDKAVVHETDFATGFWQHLEQPTTDRPTILLVDPEPEELRVFQRYLDGYRVDVVSGAATVATLAEQTATRAIVVGTVARRDDVRRALQHGDPTQCGLRVPIITCGLRTSKTIAHELGVTDYLVKPVTHQQLQRALRRFGRTVRDLVVVDDDPEMLHLLTRMVSAIAPRCQVRTAVDGWQALDLLFDRPPSGVLLDLLMPGLDGYGVLARMKQDQRLATVPVVVISARGAEDNSLVTDTLEISQVGGLHVAELCRWIRAGLDVRQPPSADANAPGRRAEPVG
jgi:signal transduction histidine kinase/CheY-like chemotaxis protein